MELPYPSIKFDIPWLNILFTGLCIGCLLVSCASLGTANLPVVVLQAPSKKIPHQPRKIRHKGKVFLLFTEESRADHVGWYMVKPLPSPTGNQKKILLFKSLAPHGVWTGKANGTIYNYIESENRFVPIGKTEMRKVRFKGKLKTLEMQKGLGLGDKWQVTIDGRIYEESSQGHLVHVGFEEYRQVVLDNGQQLIIQMRKGLSPADKWTGIWDGKQFRDP